MPRGSDPTPSAVELATLQVINDVRASQDVSIAELARRVDMSRSQLSQVFAGKKPVLWTDFLNLCGALGLDVVTVVRLAEAAVAKGEELPKAEPQG